MEHDPLDPALRNLLALRRLELPEDTEVNRFLIEFHRRQRAQLLVPQSAWARALLWLKEGAQNLGLVPSLSYASGFAAVALMAFLGFSQQVQVTQAAGTYNLSFHMPNNDSALAMLPASLTRQTVAAAAKTDPMVFTSSPAKPSATRFVLENTRLAYDATAAF
jgi:hypothetical protein